MVVCDFGFSFGVSADNFITVHNGMGYSSLDFFGLFASSAPSGYRKIGGEQARIESFGRLRQDIFLLQAMLQLVRLTQTTPIAANIMPPQR